MVGGISAFLVLAGVPVAATAAGLPRHFDLVTPPDKASNDVGSATGTVQAAESADAVVYLSATPFPGSEGSGQGNQYLALRSSERWTAESLTPAQDPNVTSGTNGARYDAFTPELTAGILQALDPPLAAGAPSGVFTSNRYRRTFSDPKGFYDLVTAAFDPGAVTSLSTLFGGASSDLEHVFFETSAALTADAPNDFQTQSYVWSRTEGLRFVGRLPDGTSTTVGSVIGRGASWDWRTDQMGSVASDGTSAVFATGVDSGQSDAHLYLWVDGGATLDISRSRVGGAPPEAGRARFEFGSKGHERIFFSSAEQLTVDATADGASSRDLYMYQPADDTLTDLTTADPAGGGLLGVLGASDDGSRVYFAAAGVLASGATAGEPNLYLWTAGEGIRYIARVPLDSNWGWGRTDRKQSRVSADGTRLTFVSADSLTGQDVAGLTQVYVYDARAGTAGTFSCASCRRDGRASTAAATTITVTSAAQLVTTYLPRTLSRDGSRVFFNTSEDLVREDVNGQLDVYQYSVDDGSVQLISSGTGEYASYFGDATISGDDVFFTTRQRLSGWDKDDNLDLYDARVAGPPLPQPPPQTDEGCEGDACQGTPRGRAPQVVPGSTQLTAPSNRVEEASAPGLRTFSVAPLTRAQRRAWARTGRTTLRVRVSNAGRVQVLVRARIGRRTLVVASGRRSAALGKVVDVAVRLSPAAMRQLRRTKTLPVTVSVSYSGVRGSQRTRLTLRRAVAGRAARPTQTRGAR